VDEGGRVATLTWLVREEVGEVGEGGGGVRVGEMWVRVGTEESMQDLTLHPIEYFFLNMPCNLNLRYSFCIKPCT
jgi:hypothetical protein